jgi:NAD(P)H-flavin reductase
MVVKAYQVGGVSEQLAQQDVQEYNRILGSYGRGLELADHSEGLYTVLCAGTGVLPVLDLVYYMYTSLRQGTKQWTNFKLKLVGSF